MNIFLFQTIFHSSNILHILKYNIINIYFFHLAINKYHILIFYLLDILLHMNVHLAMCIFLYHSFNCYSTFPYISNLNRKLTLLSDQVYIPYPSS